jgi:hypothetical protein
MSSLDSISMISSLCPKVRANYILSLALRGNHEETWHFAEEVLRDDPANLGAAGLAFQVASMSNAEHDPLTIVPTGLLDDLNVSIPRISYLRPKGGGSLPPKRSSGSWKTGWLTPPAAAEC